MSENVTKNNNYIKIIFGIFIFLLIGFFAYSYYIGSKENPEGNFIEKLKSGKNSITKKTSSVGGSELNYSFGFDANFEGNAKGESHSGSLSLKDGQIYSSKDAFKQRIKIGEFKSSTDGKEEIIVKDLDLVSDMFKVYYKYNLNKDLLKGIFFKIPESSEIYKMVDNEKLVLNTLGNLAKNEVIKELVLSNATSNSLTYLENHNTLEKLKRELKNDKFLDYLFVKNGESINEDGKTKQNLIFTDGVCDDLLPVFSNIYESAIAESGIGNSSNPFKDTNTCKDYIGQANGFMQTGAQVYKKGDLEKGNYDFVIMIGGILNINISYKNHNLDTWDIDLKYSTIASIKINGDASGLKESYAKVDFTNGNFSIKGEIKNGNGKIKLDSKSDNGIKGEIVMKDYYAENIDLTIFENNKNIGSLKGILREKEGNFKFLVNSNGTEINLEGEYKKDYLKINLNANENGEIATGFLEYKERYLKLDFNSEKVKINGVYDNGKIDFNSILSGTEIILNGNINSYKDFEIKGSFKNYDEIEFDLSAKQENKKTNYKVYVKEKENAEENYFKLDGVLTQGEKDGFDFRNLEVNGEFSDRGEVVNLTSKINFYYKKGGAKFQLPKDFEEVGNSILDSFVLPAFNPNVLEKQYDVIGEKVMKIYAGVFAIAGIGAVAMIPELTLAQGRAIDTGKLSNIMLTRTVLETYYGDKGEFPNSKDISGIEGCLSKSDGSFEENEGNYISGLFYKGKAPLDPNKKVSKPCNIPGVIAYKALEKGGVESSSYIILTNVETKNKANTNISEIDFSNDEYEYYENLVGNYDKTAPADVDDLYYAEIY